MLQRWPVRVPRPVKEKLNPDVPLITGQRILDGLFPTSQGRSRGHPGSIRERQDGHAAAAAKVVGCRIVVYIGCGERSNEMTEVLTEFPELEDKDR